MKKRWKNVPGVTEVEAYLVIHFLSSGYHDPGCMYLSNGDPGYPPEGDEERVLDYMEMGGLRVPQEFAEKLFERYLADVEAADVEYTRDYD